MILSYINGVLQGSDSIEVKASLAAVEAETESEQDEKTVLKELLTEAGIEFDGRAGIAKLRELAGQVK